MMSNLRVQLYLLIFFLLNFTLNQSCDGSENVEFQKDGLVEVASSGKICINDNAASIESITTSHAIITDVEVLNTLLCSPSVQNKLCIQFSTRIFHVFIKKAADDKMLILNRDYSVGFKEENYSYRQIYYTDEYECFKSTHVKEAEIITFATAMGGNLYHDSPKTMYCVFFISQEIKTASLNIKNTRALQITSKQRTNVGNHFLSELQECIDLNFDENVLEKSVINVFTKNDYSFCVKSSEYVFNSLTRYEAKKEDLNDYCKREVTNGQKLCMRIGNDLIYAIFDGLETHRKMIVMMDDHLENSEYFSLEAVESDELSIGDIKCWNTDQYKSKNKHFTIGYYNDDKTIHCILGKETIITDQLEFKVGDKEFTNTITGCDIDVSKTLQNSKTLYLTADETKFCLPNGFTLVKHILDGNKKIIPFYAHETMVCLIKLPSKVCYHMMKSVVELYVSNEYDSSTILVHRNHLVNENADGNFIAQENYYKSEIFCHHKDKFELQSVVPKHIHAEGDKICVIVSAMKTVETLTLKNVAGCNTRQIQFNPTVSRSRNQLVVVDDLTECRPLNDSSGDGQTKFNVISNYDKLKKCLEATCSIAKYSFLIDWNANPISTSQISECENNIELCKPDKDGLYVVYKVRNENTNRDVFFKSNAEIVDFTQNENKIIYASTYYKDEVVCFIKTNVDGDTSESIFKIQPQKSAIICSIVRELDSDKTVTLNTHGNCKRSISLRSTIENPNPKAVRQEKQCEAIFNHPTQVAHQTTVELRSQCISLTCAKLMYAVDLTEQNVGNSYSITECTEANNVNPCTSILEKDALVIVDTDKEGLTYRILSSRPLENLANPNAFYLPYYDSNKIVCFKVSKIKDIASLKIKKAYFETGDTICVINKKLDKKVRTEYKITADLTINIDLDHTVDANANKKASAFRTDCAEFWTPESPVSQIFTENDAKLKSCIDTPWIEVNYMVKEDNTIKTCTTEVSCNVDEGQIKFIKVTNQYNQKVLYKIETDDIKPIVQSGIPKIIKSSYNVHEIVCFRKSTVRDEKPLNVAGVVHPVDDRLCYVVNDLAENRKISIEMGSGIHKEIYLVKTPETNFPPATLAERDTNCGEFSEASTSLKLIKMIFTTLKSCIEHIGLKTIFIVKLPSGSNEFVTSTTYCDSIESDCFTGITNFEYVKLTNLYTNNDFYVQNSDERTISSAANFFHHSPCYKGEVVCILNSDLQDINQYTISNSYTLGGYKCIIVGELKAEQTITFSDASRCNRKIRIDPKTMISPTTVRDVNDEVCREFMNLNLRKDMVHSVTLKALKNCLIHTCNKIATCVEMPGTNIPLIHSNVITTTASDDTKCTDENKIYDFVRVHKADGSAPLKYFRTFQTSNLQTFVPTRTVFYDSKYYKDEIVCFNQLSLTINDNLKASPTFFQENDRICFLLNLITNQETVTNKVKEGCELTIIFSVASRPEKIEDAENTREYCSDFFSFRSHEGRYPVYAKAKLLSCVQNTCSNVEHFIELKSANEDYPTKILSTCAASPATTLDNCLANKDNLEGIKVKSPFMNSFLYLQTSDEKLASLEFFKSSYYKDAYYKDEVLCIHENLLLSKDIPLSTDGIFKKKQVTCFVPSELNNPLTITIMIYGECQKSVLLVHNQKRSEVEGEAHVDVCADFNAQQSKPYKKIPIDVLRQCLVSTCSKLDYFITGSTLGEKNVKNMHKCSTKYGDASCLSDTTSYESAKISNPSVGDKGLIINSDTRREISDDEIKKSYYKSKYYMNEIVCVHKDILKTSISENELLPLENSNQKCIIIDDLAGVDEKDIDMQPTSGCEKTIKLFKTVKRTNDYDTDDRDCLKFFTENGRHHNIVGLMTLEILKKCIQQTCSKVISYVELTSTNDLINSKTLTKNQNNVDGDVSVFTDTKYYDLVKIMSPYRTGPLMFQTYDSDAIVHPVPDPVRPLTFGSSKFQNDRFMCYKSSSLANHQHIENTNGVYSTKNRKCIIPSDLTKELNIHVLVSDTCSRNIIFSPTSDAPAATAIEQIDTACEKYTTDTQGENLIIGDLSSVMKCVAHTCSNARYFGRTQSNIDCSKESEASQCSDTNKYDYSIVSSLYKTSPFLTMSVEMKKTYTSNDITIAKYKFFYSPDEISCFKNDALSSVSDGITKFTETHSNPTLYCYHFTIKDKEYIIAYNPNDNTNKFTYFSGSNTPIKSMRISIFGRNGSNEMIELVYTYNHQFSAQKNIFSEIDELQQCASAKHEDDQQNLLVPNTRVDKDGYAFALSANHLLEHDFIFYMNRKFACGGYYKSENANFLRKKSISISDTVDMKKSDCVFVENDYPTITLNSLPTKKGIVAIEGENCVKIEHWNASCRFIFKYNDHIKICLRKKSETKIASSSSSKSSNTLFILVKKDECYYHKATATKKIFLCQLKDSVLSINVFDSSMFETHETGPQSGKLKPFSYMTSAISGILGVIVLATVIFLFKYFYLNRMSPHKFPSSV